MKRTTRLGAVFVIIGLAALSLVRIRIVQTRATPTVICHESECFLFVYESYFGWNRNLLGHLGGILRAMIPDADRPTDKAARERVFTITPAGLQQLSFRGYSFPLKVYATAFMRAALTTGSGPARPSVR
jgi:hypothetical protein